MVNSRHRSLLLHGYTNHDMLNTRQVGQNYNVSTE